MQISSNFEMCSTLLQKRYILAILASSCAILLLSGRNCLNLAIVKISKNENCRNSTLNTSDPVDFNSTSNTSNSVVLNSSFNISASVDPTSSLIISSNDDLNCNHVIWSQEDVDHLLSAFFVGIFISEVVSGPIVDIFGAKLILVIASITAALMNLMTPYLVSNNVSLMVISQVVSGIANGVGVPSYHTLIGRWEPESERGKISTIIYTGSPLSSVISLILVGMFSTYFSWTYAFYLFGSISFLLCILLIWNVYNSPDLHPHISQKEKNLLEKETQAGSERPKLADIPVKQILGSSAVWAMIIANTAYNWTFAFIASKMPTFLDNIFDIPTTTNAIICTLPFIGNYIFTYLITFFLSKMKSRDCISGATLVKIATTISLTGSAICIGLLPLIGSNVYIVATLLTAAWTLAGAHVCGAWINAIDLSPNFAASLMGLSGLVSYFCVSFLPQTFSALTTDRGTVSGWSPGLYLTSLITALANVVFIVFGTSDVQDWNKVGQYSTDL